MLDGDGQGLLRGRARTRPSARRTRGCTASALAKLDWLVVRDLVEIETAAFWYDSARDRDAASSRTEDIATEVFFLPAAAHTEKDGSLHEHAAPAAVAPQGGRAAGRLPLGALVLLPPRPHASARSWPDSTEERDRPLLDLHWDYPTDGRDRRAERRGGAAEINGCGRATASRSSRYTELKDDGSTACGCWIYCGVLRRRRSTRPRAASRHCEQSWVAPEWGWAWPANRRILYNRASADPDGQALVGAQALRLVGRATRGSGRATTCPTSSPTSRPDYVPPDGAKAEDAIAGDHPFIMQADGRGWLFVPAGPRGRAAADALRAARVAVREPALRASASNPAPPAVRRGRTTAYNPTTASRRRRYPVRGHHLPADRAPHRRRHDAASLPYLSELQPEMFCEVSPELAAERGLEHGGWATIVTRRAAIEARVLVTDRMRPLRVQGRTSTRSGCPTTGAGAGSRTGDAANDLLSIVARPERAHPGGEGGHLRHPPGPAQPGTARW